MASNDGGKKVMDSENSEGKSSEATVEIKIKTLDSQIYTLRVDKCVPVPALKEQIATVTGVLSNQQRLICRGRVLKDDQLLSAYHVEDGHTLHLVVRQPINPSLASVPDHAVPDPASSTGGSQSGPSVLVGTFNISEQGDGIPDFSRIVSAVLGSFGIGSAGSSGEPLNLQEHISERLSRIPGVGDLRNSSRQQREDASGNGQQNAQSAAFPTDAPMEPLQLPVIPDSLSTLSQYLRRLRQEFNGNVRGQSSNLATAQDSDTASHLATGQGGLPTPAALAEVTESTRLLLVEQAGECLAQLTRQLGDQANVTDPVARTRMQSNALRSGALLQNLGAFLLELGRTTMTLRMGRSPTDAVVNAGPAVFVSTSGPNPIMVQPLPFQPGTSFGTTTLGSGTSFSVGSGYRPRNIDIRIRTGSLLSSAVTNQRETSGGDRSAGTDPATSDSRTPNQQAAAPPSREPEVRVVPIRISTLPPGLGPSESSRGSVGIIYPVLARAQHVDSGNLNATRSQTSSGSRTHDDQNRSHSVADSAVQQGHPEVPGVHGASQPHAGTQHGQSSATVVQGGINQLLRNLFPGEQNHGNDFIFPGMSENSGSGNIGTAQATVSSPEAPTVTDEGTFLANLLHQIMPIVSQNINGEQSSSGQDAVVEDRLAEPSSSVEENQDRRRQENPSPPPTSKRQKRE